ncbi:MAG: amidinotransferase [Flavobacteriales bacterium]|nr:amidinotransferase [Flavobacteriales bacterium]
MIRPVAFAMNAETAKDNHYQNQSAAITAQQAQADALKEFDAFVEKLRAAGVNVMVVEDTLEPATPDSIFPNNWVSFHETGMVVLYPMCAENRRLERRDDILELLKSNGFRINETLDYSSSESDGFFLEGTGSLVLDRENLIAYACISQRTNEILLKDWGEQLSYEIVSFHALQKFQGQLLPIYHTNVMMSVGEEIAILCADSIKNELERNAVVSKLEQTRKTIVYITEDQKSSFAGNMLQVINSSGERIMVMSTQAFNSLTPEQIHAIEKTNRIFHSSLTTIETLGGGSARCMMAEVFLPQN